MDDEVVYGRKKCIEQIFIKKYETMMKWEMMEFDTKYDRDKERWWRRFYGADNLLLWDVLNFECLYTTFGFSKH